VDNVALTVNATPVREDFGEIIENINMPHAVTEVMHEILRLQEEKESAATQP
jgi:hypothetical protein